MLLLPENTFKVLLNGFFSVACITLFCANVSLNASPLKDFQKRVKTESIEQYILNHYQQLFLKSYQYYREKLGFTESQSTLKIKHFPVIFELNSLAVSQQAFYSERFFASLYANNKDEQDNVIKISNNPVVQGYLSSRFGMRKDPIHGLRQMHRGIDIAARYGSPVNPLGKGKVLFAGYKTGYGYTVEIQHSATIFSRYAHLKQFSVDEGANVNPQDQIGLVGRSGRSTGPHLHLEVLINGKQVDPQIFLVNHFTPNSGATKRQIARVKPNKKVIAKTINNNQYPTVQDFPQISYRDYVNSMDGLYGFSAPNSFVR